MGGIKRLGSVVGIYLPILFGSCTQSNGELTKILEGKAEEGDRITVDFYTNKKLYRRETFTLGDTSPLSQKHGFVPGDRIGYEIQDTSNKFNRVLAEAWRKK